LFTNEFKLSAVSVVLTELLSDQRLKHASHLLKPSANRNIRLPLLD